MNAPPFPGSACPVCTGMTGVQVITKTFLVNGSYTPSPGLVSAVVECIGGGGGGGWAGPTPTASWAVSGGGGGSGGYSRKTLAASLVAGGVNVTVAVATPGSTSGQQTSFGALCVAYGGEAGYPNDFATGGGAGGQGAPVGVGDVCWPGQTGTNGALEETPPTSTWFAIAGGIGGSIAGGATTVNVSQGSASGSQNAHGNTGAGGGGGTVNQVVWSTLPPADIPNGHITGGYGAAGMCIVTEFCWAPPMGGGRVAWGYDCD